MNDVFYNQFFNPQYMNSAYYWQDQEQSKEACNVAKAEHDLCEAYKRLDPQHQQQEFFIALAEMANEFGWNNR